MDRPPINPQDIICVADIAERFDINLTLAEWLTGYPSFPEPMTTLVIGPIWYWPEVMDWARDEWVMWGKAIRRAGRTEWAGGGFVIPSVAAGKALSACVHVADSWATDFWRWSATLLS